jgi:hypothetical protein
MNDQWWSDGEARLLTRMAAEFQSAGAIAKALTAEGKAVSRAAVIGKAHRLGVKLKSPQQPERMARMVQQRKRAKPSPPALAPAPLKAHPGYEFLKVPPFGCLMEVGNSSAVRDFLFCGEPRAVKSSYCPRHNSMTLPRRPA